MSNQECPSWSPMLSERDAEQAKNYASFGHADGELAAKQRKQAGLVEANRLAAANRAAEAERLRMVAEMGRRLVSEQAPQSEMTTEFTFESAAPVQSSEVAIA